MSNYRVFCGPISSFGDNRLEFFLLKKLCYFNGPIQTPSQNYDFSKKVIFVKPKDSCGRFIFVNDDWFNMLKSRQNYNNKSFQEFVYQFVDLIKSSKIIENNIVVEVTFKKFLENFASLKVDCSDRLNIILKAEINAIAIYENVNFSHDQKLVEF